MSAAACKAILNGVNGAAILANLATEIERTDVTPSDEIIKLLNEAEDCACKATRLFLDQVGFKGPYPHSLDF